MGTTLFAGQAAQGPFAGWEPPRNRMNLVPSEPVQTNHLHKPRLLMHLAAADVKMGEMMSGRLWGLVERFLAGASWG